MDVWEILKMMKQKLSKDSLFSPPLYSFHTKISHCCCRWLKSGERLSSTAHGEETQPSLSMLRLPLEKGKNWTSKRNKQSKIGQPESRSVYIPLLMSCDKYLNLNADYWPQCKKTPVSNVYWKSVARLPFNIRRLGFCCWLASISGERENLRLYGNQPQPRTRSGSDFSRLGHSEL